jgi:protein ImuA
MDLVPAVSAALMAAPESLHPALWRAHQLGRQREAAVRTGFAALDAQLPGGGWPRQVLTELLLPHPGVGEMRLLAPALAGIAGAGAGASAGVDAGTCRSVMLFDPPVSLCGWALAQLGVDAQQLIVIHGRDGAHGARHLLASADLLWAMEQALKSGQVGAVLAWLPVRLRADALRRLQLAAQSHDGPAFLVRDIDARLKPSPAPLRLALHSAGIDALSVRVLKRRGPALPTPLRLMLPPVLAPVLRARAEAARVLTQAMQARVPTSAGALAAGVAEATDLAAAAAAGDDTAHVPLAD